MYLVWKEILPTIWKPITCQVGVHAHVIGVRRQKIVWGAIEFFPLLAPFSILQIFVGSNHKINMRIVIPPRQVNCHLSWFVKGGMKRFRLNWKTTMKTVMMTITTMTMMFYMTKLCRSWYCSSYLNVLDRLWFWNLWNRVRTVGRITKSWGYAPATNGLNSRQSC